MMGEIDFTEAQRRCWAYVTKNEFHPGSVVKSVEEEGWTTDAVHMATRIALIHSEVSEALEEVRMIPIDVEKLADELADIVIRTIDLANIAGVDMTIAFNHKMRVNEARVFSGNRRGLDGGSADPA